jgi:hypothetical protein
MSTDFKNHVIDQIVMRLVHASVVVCVLVIGGCTNGVRAIEPSEPPQLVEIAQVYARVVRDTRADPVHTWHHDWTGNIITNFIGGSHRGLCYEWQDHVWHGVYDTIRRQGWQGVGLVVEPGKSGEHHAIVVYDSRVIAREELLHRTPPREAWVLDPWETGRPLVYTLDDWLAPRRARNRLIDLELLPAPAEAIVPR